MKNILLLGGGKIGEMIAALLATSGDYAVTVADNSKANLAKFSGQKNVETLSLDFSSNGNVTKAMAGKFAAVSAAPYQLNGSLATAAKEAGVHYLDLTEDVKSTKLVKKLAEDAKTAFIPQCGLAPGFISIVAYGLAGRFDSLHDVCLRVGALAQFPSNALKYNLTWSTDGLINEYIKPCEAVIDGEMHDVPALGDLEHFTLDGVEYEAFNTSGGLGTLAETLHGKVKNLNYRTVRYPGHRDMMKLLIKDLRLGERPEMLKEIFEYAIPATKQDVILVYVSVTGQKDGRLFLEVVVDVEFGQQREVDHAHDRQERSGRE